MEITSREEWGAVAPRSVTHVPWDQRTGFMVHYSAANAAQTVREIQRYHMETRGWADIGYNLLVRSTTGQIYMGRGWDVLGAHCVGYNTPNIGVCVIGADVPGVQDVSEPARAALRWLYAEAQRRAGRRLVLLGHRDRGQTTCPGDELYAYVRAGLPGPVAPAPAPAPSPAPAGDWERVAIMALDTIKQGSRGADVRKSQGLLAAAGFPPRASFDAAGRPDGIAGDGWGDACERFQRSRGLRADRVCGPVTWSELLR